MSAPYFSETTLYPLPRGVRGDGLRFVLWQHGRFLDSDLVALGSHAVIGAAMLLMNAAFRQDPIGTLPKDEDLLSSLARCRSGDEWAALRAPGGKPDLGCLRGWVTVTVLDAEGEVFGERLAHPVVQEVALAAVKKSTEASGGNDRSRLSRLRKALSGRVPAALREDRDFLMAVDNRLAHLHQTTGQRRTAEAVYAAAEAESMARQSRLGQGGDFRASA